MQRRLIRFRGQVQGVGFRMTAKSVAQDLGISGWVQNELDGSVLMEAQGLASQLDECVLRIQRNTIGRVDSCDESPMLPDQNLTGFEIRY